ncbi:hypothetical protein KSW81_005078 [Nannochloris sp. 'desiccata']|nr:hypothetical protein KSW81_005078 [Chlorella desiccata (nom. nud.)]
MPVGGKLVLKGGLKVTSTGVTKKKKKRKEEELTEEKKKQREEERKTQGGISVMSNKSYEEEFSLEMSKAKEGKAKAAPWSSGYKKAPEILHGYDKKVKGKTAEERLDMRSGSLIVWTSKAAMPLIVICGHPCKTPAIKMFLVKKNTRGLLRSVVDRNLNKSRVVIFDSLNNIKGYRYELYCIAKAAATRYCMVHVDTPAETCEEWNETRVGSDVGVHDKYSVEIFDDLAGRFERPDARNRWDAPLFTVSPTRGEDHVEEQVAAVAATATETSSAAALAAAVAAGASAGAPTGKDLKSNLATATNNLSATNLLHEIDKATQSVLDKITEAQAAAGSGPPGYIHFNNDKIKNDLGGDGSRSEFEIRPLHVPRQIPLPELRRHKRMFLKLTTNNIFNRVKDVHIAKKMFVDYLRDQIEASG